MLNRVQHDEVVVLLRTSYFRFRSSLSLSPAISGSRKQKEITRLLCCARNNQKGVKQPEIVSVFPHLPKNQKSKT
jgi:hypothetical protein